MPSKVRPQSVTETIFICLRYYALRINKLLNSYWSIFQIVSCDACTLYIVCAAILNCQCRGSLGREWFRTLIPCSCWNAIRTADKLCCFLGGKLWAQGILALLSRRWSLGSWTECSKSCNDGTHGARSREVFCVEDSEGTEVEISDSHCKKPKPATHEQCGRQPCPAEWSTVRAGPVGDL